MSQLIYRHADEIDFSGVFAQDFELRTDNLVYQCRFQAFSRAERLFVSLNSSRAVSSLDVGHFALETGGHVLTIRDPTLLLNSELGLGTFSGTKDDDPVYGVIGIAERVAASLGLDRSRIVYWAASGAGLGAAMAAVKSGTAAVLVNPMLDSANMGGSRVADGIARTFGVTSSDELTANFPVRTRLSEAIGAAEALGLKAKLLLVQNKLDKGFFSRQFEPFCRSMNLPLQGGQGPNGRIRSLVYSHPSGHAPEPEEIRARILRDELPWLIGRKSIPRRMSEVLFEVNLTQTGRHVFGIPPGVSCVRLLSSPGRVGDDPRTLGAAITELILDGQALPLSDPCLAYGFYALESIEARKWRWTDGNALLPIVRRTDGRRLEIEVLDVAAPIVPLSSRINSAKSRFSALFPRTLR